MLIQGSLAANKTEFLIEKYVELLNSGVSASKILVLVQNSTLKQNFINSVLERLEINGFEKLNVHSFFSLVYNSVSDNWAVLEGVNPDKNRSVIIPNLVGLEVSQFILKNIIKDVKFRGYNSRKSLLHQIFRRYSLIVQNNLSAAEVEERAKILKEPFKEDIDLTLKLFLQKTLKLRSFDYLRQCLVFNYIYKNTDYFKDIEYLLLDDGDEITPVCFDFIEHLAPQLKDWWLAYDFKGSSRVGYLSADKPAVWEFERLFKEKTTEFEPNGKMWVEAEKIFDNVLYEKANILSGFSHLSLSKRSGMIDLAVKEIKELLDNGVLPCEISLITPCVDEMLRFTLGEKLGGKVSLKPLCGSEKLVQNRLVLSVLNILKLSTDLRSSLTEFNLRPIFNDFLNIPLKYCDKILAAFEESKNLIDFEFPNPEHTEKEIREIVNEKLGLVGLKGIENLFPSELSGGMQKRVSFARAIVTEPKVILYDEPTAGLDPIASTLIEDYILRLRNETGATSIVVTHQMSTIQRTADKVIMLYDGKIVFRGTPQELCNTDNEYAKQFVTASIDGPMKIIEK